MRSTGGGSRLHAGFRVLLAGADAKPRLARARRSRQSRAVRRGEQGLDRRRRRARAAGCFASCWDESAITRGCSIRSARPTASGSSARSQLGLYPRGRRVLHELEELVPEHMLVEARCAPCSSPRRASASRHRVVERTRAARRADRGAAHLAGAGGCRAALQQGVRGRADARSGGERRCPSARAVGSLAGRRPRSAGCCIARSWPATTTWLVRAKGPDQLAAAIEIV